LTIISVCEGALYNDQKHGKVVWGNMERLPSGFLNRGPMASAERVKPRSARDVQNKEVSEEAPNSTWWEKNIRPAKSHKEYIGQSQDQRREEDSPPVGKTRPGGGM